MQNIENQISAMRKLGREFGLASYKRKDMIGQAVTHVKAAQEIAGESGFEAALDTLRQNFYETAFAAYLYPNEKESDRTLQAALSVIEKATKLYDSREKAAYDSVRSAWSAVRKACDIKDASRSQGATNRAANSGNDKPEADKPEAAKPEAVKMTIQSGRDVVQFMALKAAECVSMSDQNTDKLEDYRHGLAREAAMEFRRTINEILNMPEEKPEAAKPKGRAKK